MPPQTRSPRFRYLGPAATTTLNGTTVAIGESVRVSDDVAGVVADTGLADAEADYVAAFTAQDETAMAAAASLIRTLHSGSGMRSQPLTWEER